MSITYDEAMQTLQVMFPEWDKDMIVAIFQNNNYHMERTIEVILSMGANAAAGDAFTQR